MYKFNTLQLTNYLLWEDLEFTFEKGLTFVHGRNRSGKSLLASPIPAILYDSYSIPDKARATLNVSNDQHEYDFTVFNMTGKKNKFEVAIDGKSQKTETRDAALNLISQHFSSNIQSSLFGTTVSISSLSEHPLAKKDSKPLQRLDWVHETLAYASVIDQYLEETERLLKSTRDDSIKFNLFKQQLHELKAVDQPEEDIDKIKNLAAKIVADIKELEEKQRLLTQAIAISKNKVKKPEISQEEAEKKIAGLKGLIKYLNELKPLYDSYEEDIEKYKYVKKTIAAAKEDYIKCCEILGREVINPKKALENVEVAIEKLRDKINSAFANNNKYENQEEDRKLAKSNHPLQWPDEQAYTSRISGIREQLTITSSQLKFIEGDDRNCPVCGSSKAHLHKPKELQSDKDKLQNRLKNIEYDYKVWKARQKKYVEYIDVDSLKSKIKKLEALKYAAETYVGLKKHDVEEPEKVEFDPEKLKKARIKLTEYEDILVDIKAYKKSQRATSGENNPYEDNFKADNVRMLEEAEVKLKEQYTKQQKLTDKIVQHQTQIALHNRYREEKTNIISKAKPLKQANSDNRLLAVARKALGRDGFRTRRLESTLELFVHNLNEFAPLLWDENFKFDIEIGPRKCDIIVHRNKKAGTTATLSGSEQRGWQLLCGLSMLRLLPYNRRCDTIILDEVEANMDIPGRSKLIQDFLPELQKTVDKVILISPLTKKELALHPDRAFLVEKRSAKSRLTTM